MSNGQTQAVAERPWWAAPLDPVERRRLTILVVIVLAYVALAQTAASIAVNNGVVPTYAMSNHAVLLFTASPFMIAVGYLCTLVQSRERRPLKRIWHDLTTYVLRRDRLLSYSIPLLLMPLFVPAFLTLKSLIPVYSPFAFDTAFYELDRALHGGIDPWRITHALFGGDLATGFITFLYNLWFILIWGVALYAILRLDRPAERFHYICALMVCWIINGTLIAYLLSSAGPCYYGLVLGGSDPYQPLFDTLKQIDARLAAQDSPFGVWSLQVQDMLWQRHILPTGEKLGGISAMPSMHVSLALLMAMGMWRFSRRFSALLWVYAALIMVGSVHLGWHYAVDGYVSIVTTVAIWHAIGWAIRFFGLGYEHRPEPVLRPALT